MAITDGNELELKISVRYKRDYSLDELPTHLLTLEADMVDVSVHAWFEVFQNVLRGVGFTEENIMAGACQLAFNEYREPESMKKIADRSDLTLNEFKRSRSLDTAKPGLELGPGFSSPFARIFNYSRLFHGSVATSGGLLFAANT
jgi:hypothetical protein